MGYLYPTSVRCTLRGIVAPNVASFPSPHMKNQKGGW